MTFGKILLLNTNRMRPRISPIGLDYVASALTAAGAELKFFDLALEAGGWQARLKKSLDQFSPDLIGITLRNIDDCYFLSGQSFLGPIQWLTRWLKKNSPAKIVLGGVGFSIAPGALLEYLGGDYGVWGDGEQAASELLRVIAKGRAPSPKEIPGLVIPGAKDFTRAEINPDRFFRSRKLSDQSRYFRMGGQIGIETKRGCDGRCIYCADPLAKGGKIRRRSPEAVADEIEELLSLGAWAFHICDSEFNRPYQHAASALKEIARRGLKNKIALYGYFSPRPFDQELAKLYLEAGGKGICFGADSGSERVLQTLRRDHSPEDLERAAGACRKAGIKVMYDLLIGAPGETRKTIAETIRLMKKLKPDRVGLSYGLRVYAHTELHRMIEDQGGAPAGLYARGTTINNPELIFPIFYLAPEIKKDGLEYLHNLIGKDPRFFLPARTPHQQNYNYSGNLFLEKLIKKGARGAFWKILMDPKSAIDL